MCMVKYSDYKFKSVYKFLDIVYNSVENDVVFWNFDRNRFVNGSLKFCKDSLLHLYVSNTLYNHYEKLFYEEGDAVDIETQSWWINLLKEYNFELTDESFDEDDDAFPSKWFAKNNEVFGCFFEYVADELVHILFNDKQFLVRFNLMIRNIVKDEEGEYINILNWPNGSRNENGTIPRCIIPRWVKRAVYHRDKGHCVFCNCDLTGLVNILRQENYDHIVPLKDYGVNDPSNIQLTCEECNKKKGGREVLPKYKYQSWW